MTDVKEGENTEIASVEKLKIDEKSNETVENVNNKLTTNASNSTPHTAPDDGGRAFSEQFRLFSKFGDSKSDGKHISLSQSDKWMKQSRVIDNKLITTTDTGIYFKKLKAIKVTEADYKKFLEELCKNKKIDVNEIKLKMASCGIPGLTSNTSGSKTSNTVERLTDPSKYTGSHKQRFDESGKGRGIAGRKDLPDKSGYVSGYQNKNTYNKNHP